MGQLLYCYLRKKYRSKFRFSCLFVTIFTENQENVCKSCRHPPKKQQPSMSLDIIQYNETHKEEWDAFVKTSKNGTFLFERNYMDYHKERFTDASLMIYNDNRLCALLPATLHEEKDAVVSHGGLTYGSLIIDTEATSTLVLEIFSSIIEHYRNNSNAKKIIYKAIPYIYHLYPSEEDLYALFRLGARLTERKISSTIKLSDALPFKGRRKMTATKTAQLRIVEDGDFVAFWNVLTERLQDKYDVTPVHSIDEIELLHSRFPNNIKLFRVTDLDDTTLGGVVVYIMKNVAHLQYICTTDAGRKIGVMDHLYTYLIKERFAHMEYLDFGISTEQGGHVLNEGLIANKERFGGRAVMYDAYEITIER